jgi:hypothetical protein
MLTSGTASDHSTTVGTTKEMNMKHIRATFEDFEVEFAIGSRENQDTVSITQLAYEMLKEEGADCLLSEVEWSSEGVA